MSRPRLVGVVSVVMLVAALLWGAPPAGAGWENDADVAPPFDSTWGSQGGAVGQFDRPRQIAVDGVGRVFVADTLNDRIQVFRPDGTQGAWGSQGSAEGQFESLRGLDVGPNGLVYVADDNRIQVFRPNGVFILMWGWGVNGGSGFEQCTESCVSGTPTTGDGGFSDAVDAAIDQSGNVYVTDFGNDRVQVFSPAGDYLTSWGTQGSGNGQFDQPRGIAIDADGNVYVADGGNSRIQKFTGAGTWLAGWGSSGSGNGQFDGANGIAVDVVGNLHVSDASNHRVQVFDSSGTFLTSWGTQGSGNGQFEFPNGVAVDTVGNVYVVDVFNHRIQKFGAPPVELNGPAPIVRLTDTQTDDSWEIEAGNSLTFRNDGATPFTIDSGAPADAVVLAASGNIGVGTATPSAQLTVTGDDARIKIERTGPEASQTILNMINNGRAFFRLQDTTKNDGWQFGTRGTGFEINLAGSGGSEFRFFDNGKVTMGPGPVTNFELSPTGDLEVQGTITDGNGTTLGTLAAENQALLGQVADLEARLAAMEEALAQLTD